MDPRNPISGTVIEGKGLTAERRSASRPAARKYYALAVVVFVIAFVWALYAANAAQGVAQ